jgi:hypothetical protein
MMRSIKKRSRQIPVRFEIYPNIFPRRLVSKKKGHAWIIAPRRLSVWPYIHQTKLLLYPRIIYPSLFIFAVCGRTPSRNEIKKEKKDYIRKGANSSIFISAPLLLLRRLGMYSPGVSVCCYHLPLCPAWWSCQSDIVCNRCCCCCCCCCVIHPNLYAFVTFYWMFQHDSFDHRSSSV